MKVTQFENEDFLINCYLDKLRSANMVYGVIRMRLVALYGVSVLEKLRDMTDIDEKIINFVEEKVPEEIIDIVEKVKYVIN